MPNAKPSIWNTELSEIVSLGKRRIPQKELSVFCRKFSIMLDTGESVKQAVLFLAEQASTRAMRDALTQSHSGIMQGKSLSAALAATDAFPVFFCGLCQIGEMSARLPQVMERLATFYEQQARAEDELSAALMYPAAVALMMLAVAVLAVVYVLPGYARVFTATGVELPVITKVLMSVSAALTQHTLEILIVVIVLIAAVTWGMRSAAGRALAARVQLHMPVLRAVYRQAVNLRFSQAMSLLLASGQALTDAVPACAEVIDNPQVRRDLVTVATGLKQGRSFWEMLSGFAYFDPMLWRMVQVGEETGRLPQTMSRCRDYFEQEYISLIRKLNKLVEPVITLVLGVGLGLMMLAVILPTFALTNIY